MYIVAAVLLLRLQIGRVAGIQIFSTVLYLFSALLVFLGSAIYHGMKPGFPKRIARVADHSNIYIMISGTVTSFYTAHVYPTNPKLSLWMILLVWVLSAVGILLTFMNLKKFNIPQIFMYILLGWIAVFGMRSVSGSSEAGKDFIHTILIAGAVITTGAMIYFVGKKFRYFHAVFHVFVLAGNIIIFFATYHYFQTILLP